MKKMLIKIYNYLLIIILPFKCKTKIINDNKIIERIKKNRLSLIRFGDGEYRIMYSKKGICYQEYSESLRNDLLTIFKNYNCDSKYIICIPPFFLKSIYWFMKNDSKYTMCFAKPRFVFRIRQNKKLQYGDYSIFGKGKERTYKKIWEDVNNIIIIHNNNKIVETFNKTYNKNAIFIKSPEKNSYNKIDEIIKQILNIKNYKDFLILISSGPMAKVLSYKLTQKRNTGY